MDDLQEIFDKVVAENLEYENIDFLKNLYIELFMMLNTKLGTTGIDKELLSLIIDRNVILIKSLTIDHTKSLSMVLSDAIANGQELTKTVGNIEKVSKTTAFRAETIAITEMAKANTQISLAKFKEIGVEYVTWSSSSDKRTRPCHRARGGKTYEAQKGLYSPCDGKTLHTGQEVRCRCAMSISL